MAIADKLDVDDAFVDGTFINELDVDEIFMDETSFNSAFTDDLDVVDAFL